MSAHKARPLFHDMVRSLTQTFRYPSVCLWHQLRSLLDRATDSEQTGSIALPLQVKSGVNMDDITNTLFGVAQGIRYMENVFGHTS